MTVECPQHSLAVFAEGFHCSFAVDSVSGNPISGNPEQSRMSRVGWLHKFALRFQLAVSMRSQGFLQSCQLSLWGKPRPYAPASYGVVQQ